MADVVSAEYVDFSPWRDPEALALPGAMAEEGRLRRGTAHFGRTLRQFLLNVVPAFAAIGYGCSSGFLRTLSWCIWRKIELLVLV